MPLSSPSIPDPARSALMSRIRSKGTAPELIVGRVLRNFRLAYRKNVATLAGSPDFANQRRRWAVFVQGCFWHHHACPSGRTPKTNIEYWTTKFARNRVRDAIAIRTLRKAGYRVVAVWECECRDSKRLVGKLSRILESNTSK